METPFFFKNEGRKLYGMTFIPERGALRKSIDGEQGKRLGVLFCSAFAEEKLWSQRVMVSFARRLSKKGISAMTFDYRGHGDSGGDFVDSTIETRLSDISRAIEVLREKTHADKVGLLGLRLGGTLAAVLSARGEGIDFLILWEPILNAGTYIHQCLRSNLTTQMVLHRKIERNREQLINDLLSGIDVNIDGYLISGKFYEEALKINLEEGEHGLNVPSLVIKIVKSDKAPIPAPYASFYAKGKAGFRESEMHKVKEEYFWAQCNSYPQECLKLFSVTEEWLKSIDSSC